MADSKAKILIHNTKWIYISKIVTQILGLVATVLVIRKLSVDIFGTYNILLNSFVVFQILAISSVSNIFNRYIPELISNQEYGKFKKFFFSSAGLATILLSLLIITLNIYKDLFASFFKIGDFSKYYQVFVFYCYASFLQILIDTVLKALLLHKKVALITILNMTLRTSLYIILFNRLDIKLLLWIEIILAFIFLLQGIIIYKKYIANFDTAIITTVKNPVTFKRVSKYGLLSFINELGVGVVGKTSDYFIVAAISNPFNVGLYAFARRIYEIVFKLLPYKDFQTVVRPLFFQKYIHDYEIEDFRKTFGFMIKILLPLYVVPVIYFFFFGKQIIINVFDPKYVEAYWVTIIILSSNLFFAFFFPLSLFAQLKERMDVLLYSKITIIFSLIAGIYGMKLFGILGVAMASLIGDFIKNCIILMFLRKYPEIKYNLKNYSNYVIILLTLSPFYLITLLDLNLILLIIATIVFFCYLFVSTLIFHPFNKDDMFIFKKFIDNSEMFKKISIFIEYCYNMLPDILTKNRII